MRPTVLIADDQQLLGESLRSLLSPFYNIVGIATNGKELIDMAVQYKPTLVLTDLSMPQMNGLDAIHTLIGMGVRSKFIFLTMHVDISLAVLVFRAGASAFVLKSASSDDLKEAINVVLGGGCYLSPQFPSDLVSVLAEAARRPMVDLATPQLTPRQREVLHLVAEGKTMKEIASQLNISTRTAESYKYHLMTVLGIRTTAELVQHAIKIGLICVRPLDAVV
ncbi:MAG: response regulator transcription factor [Terracidiphilus sp.]|jgi:DNA-binding NarL/FixJ family response regulator